MKKYFAILISIMLCCAMLFAACGKDNTTDEGSNPTISDPSGSGSKECTEVVKITYSTVDYMGGYTKDYLLDFNSDTASKRAYLPHSDIDNAIPEYQQFADFTKSAATVFFDKCYMYGLFSLEKLYVTQDVVCDGGGWSLTIEYVDGTTFSSTGVNAGPYDVFEKCKFAFYELCGEGVVGSIPSSYLFPPNISLSFIYQIGNTIYSTNALAEIRCGNYLWNGHSVSETYYYNVNRELSDSNEFDGTCQYTLVLYTANYQYSKKFNKFTLTCYDYNEEMSDEHVIFSSKWFKQKEFPLQLDKIYIYKLYWSNGDFAEYTFNTKLHN